MPYIENPKTKGSGIVCAIPQRGTCPHRCADCFFQSGRSYLEPLDKNLPNVPPREVARGRVVRVNDGHDSNFARDLVIAETQDYTDRFFNTASARLDFPAPVVLTVNPGQLTDTGFHTVDATPGLMFVRVRVNTWNVASVVVPTVRYYQAQDVPVALTFMAYHKKPRQPRNYEYRDRTLNPYWCICPDSWQAIMERYRGNPAVWSCSGPGSSLCRHCGACLREYYAAKERMRK